jgi:hypothetical protein
MSSIVCKVNQCPYWDERGAGFCWKPVVKIDEFGTCTVLKKPLFEGEHQKRLMTILNIEKAETKEEEVEGKEEAGTSQEDPTNGAAAS